MSSREANYDEGIPFFPLMEIFGGAFGILVVVLVLLMLMQEKIEEQQKDPNRLGGISQLNLGEHGGYVVSCFKDSLYITETKEALSLAELRTAENKFRVFCENYVTSRTGDGARVLFFLYPGSNNVMLEARRNLVEMGYRYFNYFVINHDLVAKLRELNDKVDVNQIKK